MGQIMQSFTDEAWGVSRLDIAKVVMKACEEIERQRGVIIAPSLLGLGAFSGDSKAAEIDEQLSKRAFDWRVDLTSEKGIYMSVTFDNAEALGGREKLWIKTYAVDSWNVAECCVWGCFAQLEALLQERKVINFVPASYGARET